jgi:cytochrome c oxidase assembly factor CtaG
MPAQAVITSLAHAGQPPAPHDLLTLTAWAGEPVALAGIALLAVCYQRGLRALWASAGRGQVVARWQARTFWAGLGTLAAALGSPLDALSSALFSAHMVQHLLISLVAAPLLALGAPAAVLPRALADTGRRRVARWQGRARRVASAWPGLPAVALAVYAAVWFAWHAPPLYDAALRSDAVHAAEHASLLAAALAFWAPVVRPRRTPVWAGPLLLLGAAAQGGILAALLVFAPRALYAHGAATRLWGLDPLSDQALAGVIMWVPGGIVYLLAAAALFARWLDRDARKGGGDPEPHPDLDREAMAHAR